MIHHKVYDGDTYWSVFLGSSPTSKADFQLFLCCCGHMCYWLRENGCCRCAQTTLPCYICLWWAP